MNNQNHRSSVARIFSFIVLLGIIPAWFFYIGIKYKETVTILEESQRVTDAYSMMGK
jgi:hypothetical protein